MPHIPYGVLILHGSDKVTQQVRSSVPASLAAVAAPDWEVLMATAVRTEPGVVIVLDSFFGQPPGQEKIAPQMRDLRHQFPGLPVIAAWSIAPGQHDIVRQLGEWHLADVLDTGSGNDSAALRNRLAAARRNYFARVLAAGALAGLSAEAASLVARAIDRAARGILATPWAKEDHLSSRTLLRHTAILRLPPPRRLLSWMRVLLAADLMDNPGHTLTTAARVCGYAGDMPLRRAVKNLVGSHLLEIRRSGALATASAAFAAETAQLRQEVPSRPVFPTGRPPKEPPPR